ncbi:Pycsar system effector family protein [Rufibacter radiotolerans]|uniref:Pycsar system effector family protein n=1 Tax=Rufibacter radiotolerans TaxID=1379910 RepID=UPI0006647653|nr:Pycsar system effector family protein [Rufibacter radiotolerans]
MNVTEEKEVSLKNQRKKEKESAKKQEKKTAKLEAIIAKERLSGLTNMYRTAARNHVSYIAIGDRRANILISICTLVISVIFTFYLRKFEDISTYLIPGVTLIITCTITLVLAIFSTRPDRTRGYYTLDEVASKDVNLLHFENFHRMSIKEYEQAMDKLLESGTRSRHALMRDLHGLGVSVARKYHYLRMAYNVMMVGFVLTVVAFFAVILGHM